MSKVCVSRENNQVTTNINIKYEIQQNSKVM